MQKTYFVDKTFQNIDFNATELLFGEYENCSFQNCDFSNFSLSKFNFSDCEFIECNLSLSEISNTGFQDVKFIDCKLLGLHFENCSEFRFGVTFENCVLNLSSFYQRKMKKSRFVNCSLREVDFTECDLTSSLFDNCDLSSATFENTILEKSDLRTAMKYSIDPERNKIKKARFSLPNVVGLLDKYDIEID